jgi:PAS domain S-box-containing protein
MPFRKFGDAHEASLYRNLVKQLPHYAIFRISPEGLIETWNTGVEKLLGYTESEFLEQPFENLFTPEDRAAGIPAQELAAAASTGRGLDERWHLRKDGTAFFAEGMITPIQSDGTILGFTKIMRDATERQSVQAALERANAELSSFAYEVAHDIQSPLRRINNFAELLSNSLGTAPLETQKHLLNAVLESAETLNQLISSLLQYATVASVPEDLETVPLDEILNQVRRNLQPLLEETRAELSWDPLPEVVGHSARLLRLLQNLVGNAVKYGRPGIPPLVHISAERHQDGCVIHVQDNGMGIDPRFAEAVFTPLKRLHGPEIKGSGLGLAICKRIVEGRGGRIWVDSTPGEGSTFHFTWPAQF